MAHIASDGPTEWTIETPTREEVLAKMAAAIERWNLEAERNINYRSFEPILGLVRCYETPECQHWAVWALANLTKVILDTFRSYFISYSIFMLSPFFFCYISINIQVYPLKYCRLVQEEHGIELLKELLEHDKPNEHIKDLAKMVIENCESSKGTELMQLDG